MLQILLVDDEPYVVDDLSVTIPWQELGFEQVHIAYSGMEALEILQRHPIDILVTDINMPQMTGMELIDLVRDRWKHIKCLLLTGYAEFEYAKQAIERQASAYLLKPVADEQMIDTLRQLQQQVRLEWEAWSSQQRTTQTLREHLPLLRDKLLNELLLGRRLPGSKLADKMDKFGLPFSIGDRASLLAIRLEAFFQQQDVNSLLLFEFAIVNIASELLQDHFRFWSCKDTHDYLVFLVAAKPGADRESETQADSEAAAAKSNAALLERIAYQLQKNVSALLGGGISVVTTDWGVFPDRTRELYLSAVTTIRQRIGPETGVCLSGGEPALPASIPSLQSLYEPPTLFHLFETNNWDAIEDKLASIAAELNRREDLSPEHVQEARHYLESVFYYIAHRGSRLLGEIVDLPQLAVKPVHTADQLREWASPVLATLKNEFDAERMDQRKQLISQVHEFVDQNLHYVSLHAIADHVGLHPVYLSKIYKSETGRRISDYIQHLKMEKAAYLLSHSHLRIYEISAQLGYSNAHYFIKLFKDFNGLTPQEYRDSRKS
ncbi:response regulator [Cohnella sp. CFH 77786]|uniref:response regulator n=1 Tax=Cohnella sp. CFH 77786 TaxID=2662265 RepID=UPI001C60A22A|nr:response regulator [Cohnella sp. CFH 77786]MBW5445234.1 response regulator [Cohnella sp. CFH 77786]